MTKKTEEYLPDLEAAISAYERRSGDNNPKHLELLALLEEMGTGFSGEKVAEKLRNTIEQKFKDAGLSHKFVVCLDQIGREKNGTENVRKILEATAFDSKFNILSIIDKDIMDEEGEELVVWEKVLPILPPANEIIEFVESLKNNLEATELILEIAKLSVENLIEEIVETAAAAIDKIE